MPPLLSDKKRFWAKVDKNGPLHPVLKTKCWSWIGSRDTLGYGQIKFADKFWMAHRFSWLIHRGPILPKMEICHHCDNRSCVNPNHLFMGTHAENLQDCRDKGRLKTPDNSGENMGWAKLTDEIVVKMRLAYRHGVRGCGYRILGKRYGVSSITARSAIFGLTWKHLPHAYKPSPKKVASQKSGR